MSHIKRFRESKTTGSKESTNSLKCSLCSSEAHHIHHIDLDNKNQASKNLQPLCTACHSKIHGIEARISEIKRLVILLNRTQKARIAIGNQVRAFQRIELTIPQNFQNLVGVLEEQEKAYEKEIKKIVENGNYPSSKWLLEIKGIKHVLAAKLLAYIDFSRTLGVGKLWAYAGLTPNSKKAKGKTANWNQELRMICCGQIADSFIKQRTPKYRAIYDAEKARQLMLMERTFPAMQPTFSSEAPSNIQDSHSNSGNQIRLAAPDIHSEGKDHFNYVNLNSISSPPKSKMHAHKRAIRKMVKEFLKDYYLVSAGHFKYVTH
jgi:hypothetical protein